HPVADLAAQLTPLDRELAAGHHAAGQHDGDGRPGAEIPRAAHDRPRLARADVDARELELVRVRVLVGLEHLADDEVLVVAAGGDAAADDAVDLAAREDETPRELFDRKVEIDVLAQPADRHLHEWSPPWQQTAADVTVVATTTV